MRPVVSVVIVTYNSALEIDACLISLREHTAMPFEAILVDNDSEDDSVDAVNARHPWASVIRRRSNGGLARAVNEGVAASVGEVVVVLNPDTHIAEDVIGPLVALLRANNDMGIVAPRLLNSDGSVQLSCRAFPGHSTALFNRYSLLTRLFPRNRYSRRYLMSEFGHNERRDVDWVSGAALAFPRAVFDRVDGWDPGYFMFSEDVDFCKRVHDAGFRVVYEPSVSITHDIGASRRSAPARMVVERHRSMWRYYRRHLHGNVLVDCATAGGIASRCAALLLLDSAKRALGRDRT